MPASSHLIVRTRQPRRLPDARPNTIAELVTPPVGEIAIIVMAMLVAAIGLGYGRQLNETTNFIVPLMLIVAMGYGIVSLVSRSFDNIWTPLMWSRVAFIFYFGVGSLVPGFVNDRTLNMIESFYYFFPEDVAKYNLVNALFALTFLVSSGLLVQGVERLAGQTRARLDPSGFDRRVLGLILIAVGLVIYFGFSFNALLGVADAGSTVLISQLSNSVHVGIFLLASWAIANKSPWMYFVHAVTLILFVAGMLTLAKYEAILPVIMLGLAYVYERRSLRVTLIAAGGIYFLFSAISEPIAYARAEAGTSKTADGGFGSATIGERAQIFFSYGSRDTSSNIEEFQNGWARLSYVNAATFAINQFDAGLSGNSLEYLPIVWVPRLVYPDKPILTDKARDFNVAIRGSDASSSTPGLPSEGYWNFGWMGVVGVAAFLALILSCWSYYTILALQSGAWYLLLVILLGMRVGTRIDGMIVTDIVGPIGYAIVGHIGLTFLNRLVLRRKQQRMQTGALARA